MHNGKLLPFKTSPDSLCLLRLSAIGDICHVLPVVRTIQKYWPLTKLTWIIGKTEHQLVHDIPGINFIIFDKSNGLAAYLEIARHLKDQKFDALLHMQMSLRASLVSLLVKSKIKLGFDRQRAKDMQWLFTNHKIRAVSRQHVIDSFFCFTEALGIPDKEIVWDIPISDADMQSATDFLAKEKFIVISPCSGKSYRNWNVAGYAKLADYIVDKYAIHVCLTGGNSETEEAYGREIMALTKSASVTNLIGKTTLKELLAVIKKSFCVISPDSGPAHMATAAGTPVIGLYATTNPSRARPYLSEKWVVSRYEDAIRAKFNKDVSQLPWGIRVRDPGTMDRITIAEVQTMLDKFIEQNH